MYTIVQTSSKPDAYFGHTHMYDIMVFPFDKQTCFADVAMQEFAIYQINMTKGSVPVSRVKNK